MEPDRSGMSLDVARALESRDIAVARALELRDIVDMKADLADLKAQYATLAAERDRAVRWALIVLGSSVLAMGGWIFKLITGKAGL